MHIYFLAFQERIISHALILMMDKMSVIVCLNKQENGVLIPVSGDTGDCYMNRTSCCRNLSKIHSANLGKIHSGKKEQNGRLVELPQSDYYCGMVTPSSGVFRKILGIWETDG